MKKINQRSPLLFICSIISILLYIWLFSVGSYNLYEIIIYAVLTSSILFGLSAFCKLAVLNAVSKNLNERTAERLTCYTDTLIFSFRNKYKTNPDDRIRIYIPLKNITNVKYDNLSKRLILTGDFVYKYAKNCELSTMPPHRGHISHEENITEFVIYDYFEPSLYEYITNREQD